MRNSTRKSVVLGMTALGSALAIGAVPVQAKDSDPVSVDATSAQGVAMQVDNPDKLKGVKRVAIGSFMVDVVEDMRTSKDLAGIELVTGAPSSVSIKVKGLDPARYQAIVDAMYAKTEADLKAQGFEVVPNAEVMANPDMAKLVAKNNESPRRVKSAAGENLYFTAHGLPQIVTDELALIPKFRFNVPFGKKPKADPYIGSFSVGMNSGMAIAMQNSIGKQLNAAMLNVRITLLASQASLDPEFFTEGSKKTHAVAAIAMVPVYNRFYVAMPDGGKARVSLRDQVVTGAVGDLENITSGTKKATQTAGNVARVAGALGMLGGFSPFGSKIKYANSIDYEAKLDQAKFEQGVKDSYAKVSTGLVTELANRR